MVQYPHKNNGLLTSYGVQHLWMLHLEQVSGTGPGSLPDMDT